MSNFDITLIDVSTIAQLKETEGVKQKWVTYNPRIQLTQKMCFLQFQSISSWNGFKLVLCNIFNNDASHNSFPLSFQQHSIKYQKLLPFDFFTRDMLCICARVKDICYRIPRQRIYVSFVGFPYIVSKTYTKYNVKGNVFIRDVLHNRKET